MCKKNKIDAVEAVFSSVAKKLVALGLAAVTIGVGNAGNFSLIASAQPKKPTITIDKKGVKVQNDSATSNYTYFGVSLDGIERVGITNGDNFIAVKDDENSVEVYGNDGINSGDRFIGHRGTTYI